jgi:DNA-directed RNA polymerase specialized sigma24 family protein
MVEEKEGSRLLSYMLRNRNTLISYAMKFGAKGCAAKAEDIYQESLRFVTTMISKNKADPSPANLRTYAIQIVKHRGMNMHRTEKRYEYGDTKDYDFSHLESHDYLNMDDKIDLEKIMMVAKEILSKKQFQALLVTMDREADAESIEENDISPEKIKANRRHAIIRLKQYFGGDKHG